jgi:hypothetical protein
MVARPRMHTCSKDSSSSSSKNREDVDQCTQQAAASLRQIVHGNQAISAHLQQRAAAA